MKCRRIRIANVGPVREGEVDLKRIVVLVGPNDTGKSIVARLVYALRRLDPPPSLLRRLGPGGRKKVGAGGLSRLYGEAVLLHAGLDRDEVAARGRRPCRLAVHRGSGAPDISLDFGPVPASCSEYADSLHRTEHAGRADSGSVYIPAGRVGTVQSVAGIVGLGLGAAEFAAQVYGRGAGERPRGRAPRRNGRMPPPGSLSPHAEQLCDLVDRAAIGRPGRHLSRSLSRVLGGAAAAGRRAGGPWPGRAVHRGPRGRMAAIASAGAGTLAAAPILAGLGYVRDGGALVVEEPEAHVGPSAQLALAGEMASASMSRSVQVVLTTHSDYVVKKMLALVAGRKIRPSDIGMYHFRRDGRGRSRIENVPVDPIGAADQEVFRDALDSLVEEFSV